MKSHEQIFAGDLSLVLVDSDTAWLQQLEHATTSRGFMVRSAGSVNEGLHLIASQAPAYAVIDLRLQDGIGLAVVAALLEKRPEARAIILTSFGTIASAVTAAKLGAADYLIKTGDTDEVINVLMANTQEPPQPPENPMPVDRVWLDHILRVHELYDRNISETARRLSMHRRTLQRVLMRAKPSWGTRVPPSR